jgi:hypothetical protein
LDHLLERLRRLGNADVRLHINDDINDFARKHLALHDHHDLQVHLGQPFFRLLVVNFQLGFILRRWLVGILHFRFREFREVSIATTDPEQVMEHLNQVGN